MNYVPRVEWLRLEDIIGRPAVTPEQAAQNLRYGRRPRRPRPAIPAIIPVCKTSWEMGLREGKFPAPVKIGRTRVWPAEVIEELAERIKRGELASTAAVRSNLPPRVSVKPEDVPGIEGSDDEHARYVRIRECLGYDPRERRR